MEWLMAPSTIPSAISHQPSATFAPALQDLHERSAAQLLEREAAHLDRLAFRDGAAVQGAQEIIQQSLSGRRIVEHVADERGLRRLVDEVRQTIRCGV